MTTATVTLDDLCRPWLPGEAPWLDQLDKVHDVLSATQQAWRDDGLVILDGILDNEHIDAYTNAWRADNTHRVMGWPCDTPYVHEPSILDLTAVAGHILHDLIGHPMAVHLNLTGWRSTQRNFHQDAVLNPDSNRDHYAAAWFALDDIDDDAGPFEYVPGSHREFGMLRQDLVLRALGTTTANPLWPRDSERILTPLYEDAIAERGMEVRRFTPKRGSLLLWHARLLHRGSVPNNPDLERRSLIAHLSSVNHRPDMPPAKMHGSAAYFPLVQDHSRCGA